MSQESLVDIASYLRANVNELGSRILSTFPPLQSTTDPVAPRIRTLLRKALPAQALAITGTAKYLRNFPAAFDTAGKSKIPPIISGAALLTCARELRGASQLGVRLRVYGIF